jgi:hypothetical protein
MLKTKRWLLPVLGLIAAGAAVAQTVESPKFYKLDFVVKEMEGGKAVNSRTYFTMLAVQASGRDASKATIRAGGRVAVQTGNNIQNFELGVNVDCSDLREYGADVSLYVTTDISTIVPEGAGAVPMTRQNRWAGSVFLPIKKPTVVFSSDDLSSKRQMQLELTATPIK